MKHIFLSFFLIVSLIGYSQDQKITRHGNDTIEVIRYHKNGRVKDSVWKTIEVLVGKRESIDPKHPGDSIVMNIETPFGTQKTYYKGGRIKNILYYGKNGATNKTFQYRKKGSLAVYKETPYGLKKLYNKKGKQIRESDFCKNKFVRIPKSVKKQTQLTISKYSGRMPAKTLILSGVTKQVKIKQGAMLSLLPVKDSVLLRHCVFEGLLKDSILFTKYSYDLSGSKNKLKCDSTFLISKNDIKRIDFARNNIRKTHLTASLMEFSGFNMTFLPIIVVPLFSGVPMLLTPPVIAVVAAGIPVYIISKSQFKKTVPKVYKLSEWKIKS